MSKKYAVLATILALIMISRPTLAEICAENEYVGNNLAGGFAGLLLAKLVQSLHDKQGRRRLRTQAKPQPVIWSMKSWLLWSSRRQVKGTN